MSPWLLASIVLVCLIAPCLVAVLWGDEAYGLPALGVVGTLSVALLITLSEAFHRQPFIELAVVLAALSLGGSLAFVRFLARRR